MSKYITANNKKVHKEQLSGDDKDEDTKKNTELNIKVKKITNKKSFILSLVTLLSLAYSDKLPPLIKTMKACNKFLFINIKVFYC